MDRKQFLKTLGFGSLTVGGVGIVDAIQEKNQDLLTSAGQINPKRVKEAAISVTFGDVKDGYNFPLRPKGWVTDGTPVLFVWPSERGQARGYVKTFDDLIKPVETIVFRLRMGRPEAPYYLRWRRGEYHLYTPPGALVKRAAHYIQVADSHMDAEQLDGYYTNVLLALSDLRFAIILNLTNWTGDSQRVMDDLAELDNDVREADLNVSQFWDEYKRLLTQTR